MKRPHPHPVSNPRARMEVSALALAQAQVDGEAAYLSPPLRFAIWRGNAASLDLLRPSGRLSISAPPRAAPASTAGQRPECSRAARVALYKMGPAGSVRFSR